MTWPIVESGMTFRLEESRTIVLEKNQQVTKLGQGIKLAEFATTRKGKLVIVEAKSSSPQEFQNFVEEIKEKLENSFQILVTALLKRNQTLSQEWAKPLQNLKIKSTPILLMLVIQGHRPEYMVPLQEALNLSLHRLRKIWKPLQVVAINDQMARKKGWIH